MSYKILVSCNAKFGIAKELDKIYPDANFASRSTGFDLTTTPGQTLFADISQHHDVIIINSALWKFSQTVLLDTVYKKLIQRKKYAHIICIGSTTDRVKNGKAWLYNAEKKALRDYCNTLAIGGVWSNLPKVSYISFGTLSNNQEKHPDRKCLSIKKAAEYIKWVIDQPSDISINEISIDRIQSR